MAPPRPLLAALVLGAPLLVGCGGGGDGDLTVAAAASLTDAFTELGGDFEEAHPGTRVTFTFASSGTLAAQVREGAPADVFASADEAHMAEVVEAGLVVGEPEVVARNRLVIVTPPGNPGAVDSLADLAELDVVALCAEGAPCGRYAGEVLAAAGVVIPEGSVTRARDARATLTAVSEGGAAAGIVYATDAAAAGAAVATVAVPGGADVVARYLVGVLEAAGDVDLAEAFVAHVASPAGRAVLEEHGFLAPS